MSLNRIGIMSLCMTLGLSFWAQGHEVSESLEADWLCQIESRDELATGSMGEILPAQDASGG